MNTRRIFSGITFGMLLSCGLAHSHEVRPAYLRIEALAQQSTPTPNVRALYEVLWKRPLNQEGARLKPVFPEYCLEVPLELDEIVGPLIVHQFRLECNQTLLGGTISVARLELTITEVMVHVTLSDGETATYLLKPSNPSVTIQSTGIPVGSYLLLGVEHLLYGIDHILFVIALMFFVSKISSLIKTITAFTLAHSITLAMSALELAYLPQQPVEAVIALSILFLAVERLREEPSGPDPESLVRKRTWVVAFAFGLLHGFGFAGVLSDIGLPKGNLVGALFLFNVGVELGQLIVIAIGLCIAWLVRQTWLTPPKYLVRAPLYIVGCTAAFWIIERSFGIVW